MPIKNPPVTLREEFDDTSLRAIVRPGVDDALILIVRTDGCIVEHASGETQHFGAGLPDLSGQMLTTIWPPTVANALRTQIVQATRRRCTFRLDVDIEGADVTEHHEIVVLAHGRDRALLICRNLTDRRTVERQVHDLAFCDPLTGLPNRAAFLDTLGRRFSHARLSGDTLSVMRIQLKGLTFVNQTLGRVTGSELVASVGARLERALTSGNLLADVLPMQAELTLARTEGSEYSLLINGCVSGSVLEQAGEALLALLAEPFDVRQNSLTLNVSIGIARYPQDAADADALLAKAGVALQEAKSGAGNRCVFFSSTAQVRSISRLDIAQELRWALENDQFSVRFQPCYDCDTDTIVSTEALLRWHHPLRGEVPLTELLPIAQMHDMSDRLADWVFQHACHSATAADPDGDWMISLNLFARQAFAPGLANRLIAIARHHSINPARVRFEIHEADYHRDVFAAEQTAQRLADAGFTVIIDDCGLGAISARSLLRSNIRTLKISTRMIARLPDDERARKICKALLALGRALDIDVAATGVETRQQFDALRELGCRYMQGFFLCAPVTVEELTAQFAQEKSRQAQAKT